MLDASAGAPSRGFVNHIARSDPCWAEIKGSGAPEGRSMGLACIPRRGASYYYPISCHVRLGLPASTVRTSEKERACKGAQVGGSVL